VVVDGADQTGALEVVGATQTEVEVVGATQTDVEVELGVGAT